MEKWNDIVIQGIAGIRKCAGEFEVQELNKIPYGKFRVKIYEDSKNNFVGYTNLQFKDLEGCPFAGVGHGNSVEETLKDTITYFLNMLNSRINISEEDFECMDEFDF